MKTLSIIMPWPLLIMNYGKDVENRSWKTDYRGRILVHVSKKPRPDYRDIFNNVFFPNLTEGEWGEINREWCGCIIGSVELADCVQNFKSPWAESGMWHWVLRDPVLLENPVPVRGSLGLWEYTGTIKE
jgi:hypothetical protein